MHRHLLSFISRSRAKLIKLARVRATLALLLFLGMCCGVVALRRTPIASAAPLRQEAYVWQRSWTPALCQSIARASAANADRAIDLSDLTLLAAQVQWNASETKPQAIRVAIDYGAVRAAGRSSISLALRIGPHAGPFDVGDSTTHLLRDLASSVVREAQSSGLAVSELQIDFDGATRNLAGYRLWVDAIARQMKPIPIAITALPAWLSSRDFAPLARSAGRYVLQVHSLNPPANIDTPLQICNPQSAQRAVQRAGEIGIPFRVALPTYGYTVAFDRDGKFVGLSAEGPRGSWPVDVRLRNAVSDPRELAELVRLWTRARPACMTGIIWYRLPVDDDRLNWRWPTLLSAMNGRCPTPKLIARAVRRDKGLNDIELRNIGNADAPIAGVRIRWSGATLVASDALGGFAQETEGSGTLILHPAQGIRVNPSVCVPSGETRTIGWLRLSAESEVSANVDDAISQP